MTTTAKPGLTEHHQDDDIAQYRQLCVLAVVGLILGLLSAAALIDPLTWVVPGAGILVSWLALRRIARAEAGLAGRKAALAGLLLSVLFGAAGAANAITYRALVRQQGRRFAEEWFELLLARQPQKAYQLTIAQDLSIFVEQSISEAQGELLRGGILAVLVILLFLRSLRGSFVAAISGSTASGPIIAS